MSIWKNGKLVAGGRQTTPLLSFMWADHILDDISWLRADTFSWQSGSVYQAVYQHLANDIDGKSLQSETIGGTTIQFYLADDGHKVCPASEESNVVAIYAATGVAWYYIIDTVNERFKLPRTKFGFTGLRDNVGKYVAPGAPNITGSWKSEYNISKDDGTDCSGAITGPYSTGTGKYGGTNATSDWGYGFNFNASASNSIYGASNTIQPPATQMYLYFYVGVFTQTALENTAGITAETLNDKADIAAVPGLVMPDYSTGTTATQGTEYTATDNCYLYARVFCSASGSGQYIEKQIIINGIVVAQPRAFNYCADCVMVPCAKGSTYKFENVNTGSGSYEFKVYRCIGG